ARFQAFQAPPALAERAQLLDYARFIVAFFGLIVSVFGWLVTYPMLLRIRHLNEKFMFRNKIFRDYFDAPESGLQISFLGRRISISLSYYKYVIPYWLPVVEFG